MWVILTATGCEDWTFLQYVGVRTSPFLKLGKENKKQKSHNFVIGTYIFPPRLFRYFLSSRYLSRLNGQDVGLSSNVFEFVRRSVLLSCQTQVASIGRVIQRRKKVENRSCQIGLKFLNRLTEDTSNTKQELNFFQCV